MEFKLEQPLSLPSSLFLIESQHMPSSHYFHRINSSPSHLSYRRQAISFIFQYSRQFHDPSLTYLGVNYLDRFLSCQELPQWKPWILKLISLSCVSLAVKMRKSKSSVSDLQVEGGIIFDTQMIKRMENVILGGLKWRMRSITPFSFFPFFLDLFEPEISISKHALKSMANVLVFNLQHEIEFLEFKPSVVAAAALLTVASELCPLQFTCFSKRVIQCSYVNKDELMECYNAMEDRVVNVLDQQFSSSESDKSVMTVDSPPKRRKINGFCLK